jgi:hypothetical protein
MENKVTFSKDSGKTFSDLPPVYAESIIDSLKAVKNGQPCTKVEGKGNVVIAASWSHGDKEYMVRATIGEINAAVDEVNKLADVYQTYTAAKRAYQLSVDSLHSDVYMLLNPADDKVPGQRGRKAKELPANPLLD